MRIQYFAPIVASLAVVPLALAAPLSAQAETDADASAAMLTPEQQAQIDGWSAGKQAAYAAWPEPTRTYYWSLTPDRQKLFWRLEDRDKVALSAMAPPQQEAAWTEIEARATGRRPAPPPPEE